MSRCFPFPPPGYEKKARTDGVDLLKKEKHKEKKHKKEKKDKEKREDKDRKDKDKSDRKHRDKKDRTDKSKEKKKDKERENERDKTSNLQEKKIPAQVESCNGDHKLNQQAGLWVKDKNITSTEKKESTLFRGHVGEKPVEKSLFNEGAMDKFVLDLCSRIKDEEKGSASQSTERSPLAGNTNHDRMVKNETGVLYVDKEKKEDKRVDTRNMGRQGVSIAATISVKNETGITHVEKEKKEDKRVDVRKMGAQGVSVGATIGVGNIAGKEKNENKGVSIGGGFQNRAEEIPRTLERSIDPRDKNHEKENDDKRGSKRKDKDKEKKSHGKDKEREKEKKKEEKAKEKNEQKIKYRDKGKDGIKNGLIVSQNIKLSPLALDSDRNLLVSQNTKLPGLVPNGDRSLMLGQSIKLPPFVPDSDRTATVEGNTKKRKDVEANGFLHETNVVPNKKRLPNSHPSAENGRKLEPYQTLVLRTPDRKVPPPNNVIRVNNNEQKANGKIEAMPLPISLKKPSSSSSSSSSSSKTKAAQIAQAPAMKPPHPDTKYLSEVLSVPKIEEWCGVGNEEWLSSSKCRLSVSAGPIEASEITRVWDEAVQINSADVCALPYVIPY